MKNQTNTNALYLSRKCNEQLQLKMCGLNCYECKERPVLYENNFTGEFFIYCQHCNRESRVADSIRGAILNWVNLNVIARHVG